MLRVYVSDHVGPITSRVINMASVVMTWLGGSCCVPIACRKSPSTTTIRTKLVVINKMAGARLSTVSSSMTCSVELSFCGLVHDSGPPRRASATGSGRIGDGGGAGAADWLGAWAVATDVLTSSVR